MTAIVKNKVIFEFNESFWVKEDQFYFAECNPEHYKKNEVFHEGFFQ